jgi:hypothetical protein
MLVVFSRHGNQSVQVQREVERAANSGKVLLPLRIDDVLPQEALEYYLSTPHWLDAITKPFEAHLEKLADACASLLAVTGRSAQDAQLGSEPYSPAPAVTAPAMGQPRPPRTSARVACRTGGHPTCRPSPAGAAAVVSTTRAADLAGDRCRRRRPGRRHRLCATTEVVDRSDAGGDIAKLDGDESNPVRTARDGGAANRAAVGSRISRARPARRHLERDVGAPATVTVTLADGTYTVTAASPVQVTGSSCDLPVGTVIATFTQTGPGTYSGRHGLWLTSNCSFSSWTAVTASLSSAGDTLTASGGLDVTFTKA